jgi:hypothetical protein
MMTCGPFVLTALVVGSLPHSQIGRIEQHYSSMIACMEAGFTLQESRPRKVREWHCERTSGCVADDPIESKQ